MSRLQERWARQRAARMPLSRCAGDCKHDHRWRLFATVELAHPVADVWSLVVPAEHAALLDPRHVARGFEVPGTSEGVGQRQCFVTHEGAETVVEVVEYAAQQRAVVRQVSPPQDLPMRWVHELERRDAGCVLTYAIEIDLPAGMSVRPEVVETLRATLRDYLDNVRVTLDGDDGDCQPLTGVRWPVA